MHGWVNIPFDVIHRNYAEGLDLQAGQWVTEERTFFPKIIRENRAWRVVDDGGLLWPEQYASHQAAILAYMMKRRTY